MSNLKIFLLIMFDLLISNKCSVDLDAAFPGISLIVYNANQLQQDMIGKYFGNEELIYVSGDSDGVLDYFSKNRHTPKKLLPHIINFQAKDFYKLNYQDILDIGLIWHGDNDDGKETEMYVINFKSNLPEIKVEKKQINKTAILIDESLCVDYPKLCDKIGNSTSIINVETATSERLKILHCSDERKLVSNHDDNLKYYNIIESNIQDCEKNSYSHDIYAIIAPKPFCTDVEKIIPVVFYDCLLDDNEPHIDAFKNSAYHFCNGIEQAYLKLLEEMEWNRVVILSDDTEFSNIFEKRLVKILSEENKNLALGLERCTESEEDLEQVLKKLQDFDARIIILNMGKLTTEALFRKISKMKITNTKYIWITRTFEDRVKISQSNVFNISPKPRYRVKLRKFENKTRSSKREIAEDLLKAINKNYQLEFSITTLADSTVYYTLRNGHFVKKTHSRFIQHLKRMDMNTCSFRTNNFYRPCNDFELYLILAVLLIFSIALLVISIFFMNIYTFNHSVFV